MAEKKIYLMWVSPHTFAGYCPNYTCWDKDNEGIQPIEEKVVWKQNCAACGKVIEGGNGKYHPIAQAIMDEEGK